MQTRRPLDSRPDRQTHESGDAAGLTPRPFQGLSLESPESAGRGRKLELSRPSISMGRSDVVVVLPIASEFHKLYTLKQPVLTSITYGKCRAFGR
jgi:hypothetical protein